MTQATPALKRPCTVDGCDLPHYANGHCRKHWTRMWRTGSVELRPPRVRGGCSVEACEREHYGQGWCSKHWDNWRRTGNPLGREGTPPTPALEPDLPGERWLSVADWEGFYEVSDLGRVRSLPRWTASGWRGGRVLKPVMNGRGYQAVALSRPGLGTRRYLVHQMVAAAFIGPCPKGQEVCHGPNGSLDNRASQLRYDTRAGNIQDAVREGTHANTRKERCSICGSEYKQRPAGGKAKGRYCPNANYHYRPRKREVA